MKIFSVFLLLIAPLTAKLYHLSDVEEISFNGPGTLYIAQADHNELIVRGEEGVQIKLKDHLLQIEQNEPGFKGYLVVKNLDKIVQEGSGKIKLQNLKTKNLQVVIRGSGESDLKIEADKVITFIHSSGKLFLSGKCKSQFAALNGLGLYEASCLATQDCSLDITGPGTAYVNSLDKLSLSLNRNAKVHYIGSPKILNKSMVEQISHE